MQFPRDTVYLTLATLVAQTVQRASWSEPHLEIRRQTSPTWSTLQRAASLMARHGLLRTVDTGECLSLSPSPECALLLEATGPESGRLRQALLGAVSGRDEAACRVVIQHLSELVAAGRPRGRSAG